MSHPGRPISIVKKPPYSIESVDNALQIIQLLREREVIRINEIARELGVAPSTAHRLLAMLVYRGFAVQDEQRRYTRGPQLSNSPEQNRERELIALAAPFIDAASHAFGETASLLIREKHMVRFLHSAESTHEIRLSSRTGSIMPAHIASGGKAILATLPDPALQALYGGRGQGPGGHFSAAQREAFFAEIATIRRHGIALNKGDSEQGVAAIGRAVPGRPPWLAIAVAAPIERGAVLMEKPRIEQLILHSRGLGAALLERDFAGL